jgi:protein-L-isoaspartate(D-aspartate) O-methyltransferase
VDNLRESQAVVYGRVEAAMRTVPRHLFLPEFSAADAYADTRAFIKIDTDGNALSCHLSPLRCR